MKEGKLIIYSGPSGVGKGTIKNIIFNSKKEDLNLYFSVSCTSRERRPSEVEGKDYYFISKEEFIEKINNDQFIEWAEYANNYYGTLKSEIVSNLKKGINVFLEIEIVGAKNIINVFPNSITIFILPPSLEELKNRLILRSSEKIDIINKRLKIAEREIKNSSFFKHKIINENVEETLSKVLKILEEEINEY